MSRFVYADYAATTPVSDAVVEAMLPVLKEHWGNPSSLYGKGREAAKYLSEARKTIAECLGCRSDEIYFTSCGSESDNWAIKGAAHHAKPGRRKIVTTKIEHHAALHSCKSLEKEGYCVVYVGVDRDGVVDLDELRAAVDEETALVSVMYANNEIGTIQPIAEIARIAHEKGALMFTDAVQAAGNLSIDLSTLGVDMLAISGHKIHAPKGVGALYIRRGVNIGSYIDGGGQERRRRGGTENVASIVGMAKALEIATARLPEMDRIRKMRDRLAAELLKIPYSRLNGHPTCRLPGNLNIGFEFIEGESMVLWLDMAGIAASTGSACSSDSLDPSHVLLAIGVPHEKAHGSLRLTISHETTEEDVDYIIETLPPIVQKLRNMSPLYEEVLRKDGKNE
jgi:cysteine desulfurase